MKKGKKGLCGVKDFVSDCVPPLNFSNQAAKQFFAGIFKHATFSSIKKIPLLFSIKLVHELKRWRVVDQGFSKSETVGFPSDKAWKKAPLDIYLDAYGIMIVLFDPIDTQQLSRGNPILLSGYTKYIKKGVF